MTDFFSQLNILETSKWNMVNYTNTVPFLFDIVSFKQFVNFQQQYQQFNYSYNTININQSEGLFYNSQNYFIAVIPMTFAYFCIFHLAFRLLAKFSLSKILRKYYFLLFLLIIQTDGNVQQLSFYLARQFVSIFALNLVQKLLKMVIIYYGFIFILICCTIFYFAKIFYSKAGKILMEHNKGSKLGYFYAIFHFSMKSIIFSYLHFFGRYLSEQTLIKLLLGCQLLIIALILIFFKNIFT